MPKCLIKIKDKYFEWSTVSDSPTTPGMSGAELRQYIKDEYGEDGLQKLPRRLIRIGVRGHSLNDPSYTVQDIIELNRAGENESYLTIDEIYELYT